LHSSSRNIAYSKKKTIKLLAIAVAACALTCLAAWAQQSAQIAPYVPTVQPKAKPFSKPSGAAAALFAAAKRNDEAALLVILGSDAKELIQWNDDPAERQKHHQMFAQKYEQMHRLVKEPDGTVALYVGSENWPMPIPLVQYHGSWYFDADLGRQEVRYRRIGRNEMEALQVCRTLLDAEKEYRATAHQYTAKFVSTGDSRDGLYWKSASDTTRSPIGPYLAHAGVSESDPTHSQPFHGYYYRIVLQKSDALTIVAFPAEYSSSGVMTFVVGDDGKAYEKDLGKQTASLSNQVSAGADNSWKLVE
jgi:hypothetical protein